jgi:hypothetical protein
MDKLSLTDFAAKEEASRKLNRCNICKLPKELLKEVNDALLNGTTSQIVITRWLKSIGHDNVVKSTISSHYGHIKNNSSSISTERNQRKTTT